MDTPPPPSRDDLRIEDVIAALDHPARLRVVRTLAALDPEETLACRQILPEMTRSTASHHWQILRSSGVVDQHREGRTLQTRLRREDLDARFPGIIAAVVEQTSRDDG
jgi:DNA-binding transcriptional ArsR family regulator